MRWLITGAGGMLGHDLQAVLAESDDLISFTHNTLDITDANAVRHAVASASPDVIVNCAAFTKVDDCETDEGKAMRINGESVDLLASAANESGALLVQISTDFVFDGSAMTPYEVDAPVAPISAYGRSKLRGEVGARIANRHLIVRTSWLFGAHGWNFVEAIRRQIENGRTELSVVDDQRGRPTYTPHLANAIVRLARVACVTPENCGVFHYADLPEGTWYDFACEIVRQSGTNVNVRPVTTDQFPRPARRPAYSVLSTGRYERDTGRVPDSWKEGLVAYLKGRGTDAAP